MGTLGGYFFCSYLMVNNGTHLKESNQFFPLTNHEGSEITHTNQPWVAFRA